MPFSARPLGTELWQSEVLDFLAWRGAAIFDGWTPSSAVELAARLGAPEWEDVLLFNVVSSGAFASDVRRAAHLASRELRQERIVRKRVSRGRMHGRVLARETLKRRARSFDSSIWVTETSGRQWQTEANGAIVGFLDYVRRVLHRSSSTGAAAGSALEQIDRLLTMEPLRHVSPDPKWANYSMPPWLIAKHEIYRSIWKWADAVRVSRRLRDADSLRAPLGGWLAEGSRDKLFELFALSQLLLALHGHTMWASFKLTPPSAASAAIVEAEADDGLKAVIRLDRKPPTPGVYGALLGKYAGVDGSGRRPDLQLELSRANCIARTLIEVKATEPNSPYGRDSVVKVFGYLKDYAALWPDTQVRYPRAMVLYTGEVQPISPLGARVFEDEVLLTSASSYLSDVEAVIAAQTAYLNEMCGA